MLIGLIVAVVAIICFASVAKVFAKALVLAGLAFGVIWLFQALDPSAAMGLAIGAFAFVLKMRHDRKVKS